MKTLLTVLAFSLSLAALPVSSAEDATADLEAALKNPPATGLLVTFVMDGSQAMEIGLRPGAVVISYAGHPTPTLEALAALKQGIGETDRVVLEWEREGARHGGAVSGGQIGFNAVPVVKGEPPAPLPEPTGVKFDFSSLGDEPVERWYDLFFGEEKVGYEMWRLARRGGRLFLSSEVGFDGGEEYGLEHMKVTVVTTDQPRPALIMARYENVLNGWTATSSVTENARGQRRLHYRWRSEEESGENEPAPAPRNLVPTYLVESLARFMPREPGACFHFRPLQEDFGRGDLRSALVCTGREEIEHDGATVSAWRYECRNVAGAVSTTFWVSPEGESIRVDWNGAVGVLTTKEKALAGVREEVLPAE